MQLFIRTLVPFALFTLAQALPSKAPSEPSAVPVPIAAVSTALAAAKTAGTTTAARPNNLTANAAQTDPDALLYLCSAVNCGGTCVSFHLNQYGAKACVTANSPFASGYIDDGALALSYAVGSQNRLSRYFH
jgi:hypothetical protein